GHGFPSNVVSGSRPLSSVQGQPILPLGGSGRSFSLGQRIVRLNPVYRGEHFTRALPLCQMPSDGLTQALPKWSFSFKLNSLFCASSLHATTGMTIGIFRYTKYFYHKSLCLCY